MAFTTPPTFSSGAVLTAAQLNTLSDDISYLYGVAVTNPPWHAAQAIRTAASQSINDTTLTLITFPTSVTYDTDSFFDSGVTNSTFTISSGLVGAGKIAQVDVVLYVIWATNATGYREISILHNGAGGVTTTDTFGAATTPGHNATCPTAVGAGDTFQAKAYQNSGGALNITSAVFSLVVHGIQ